MEGEFILMSAVATLFDPKRKITSSTVNEFSLIILRRSNLGVCNSSILLERSSSMGLGLMNALKSLSLCSSRSSLYTTIIVQHLIRGQTLVPASLLHLPALAG